MPVLAEHVPENCRRAAHLKTVKPDAGCALLQLFAHLSGQRDPREVALDIGYQHGYAQIGKTLGQDLQGDGLAGPGGAGYQPVAVGHFRMDRDRAR